MRSSWNVSSPSQSSPSQRSDSWICSVASATSRLVSVFSMRSRNSPPSCRANSQLKSAVWTPPMWRKPVGSVRSGRRAAWRPYRTSRVHRGSRVVGGRHPHGGRTGRGDRRRLGADLHAEPAHVAADEPPAGELRALQGGARGGRARRRVVPRALPDQPRQPKDEIYEKSVTAIATRSTSGARSTPTASCSTSGRISAPGWTRASTGWSRRCESCSTGARRRRGC